MCILIRTLCVVLPMIVIALPLQATAQAPPAPPMTLWRFLGIPQAASKVNAQIFNRRGNMPGLESKPPLKALADPANLDPKMPKAVQAAAEIKQAEDLAPQKKKAIKYLAKIGCGCYDKQGKVTDALVDTMDDCTESVRVEAVEAIKTAASEDPCCDCGSKCCCNETILKKLAQLAYERGPDGCYLEPSERVRELAVEALMVCCTTQEPIEILREESPEQKIERRENGAVEEEGPDPAPAPPGSQQAMMMDPQRPFSLSAFVNAGTGAQPDSGADSVVLMPPLATEDPVASSPQMQPQIVAEKIAEVIPRRGEVTYVNHQDGTARVQFDALGIVPERTVVRAYHKFLFQTSDIGPYVVIAWNQGEAVIRKADGGGLGKLCRGDLILVK